jgi:hypothetical protein
MVSHRQRGEAQGHAPRLPESQAMLLEEPTRSRASSPAVPAAACLLERPGVCLGPGAAPTVLEALKE